MYQNKDGTQMKSVKLNTSQDKNRPLPQKVSLKCQKGNSAVSLCNSDVCKCTSAICKQQECLCHKIHENCSMIQLNGIKSKLEQKRGIINQIILTIIKQFNIFIQQVTQRKEQVVSGLYNLSYGLNAMEMKVWDYIQGKNITPVNGSIVANVLQNLRQQKFKLLIQQQHNYIQQLWEQQKKSFSKFSDSIQYFLLNPKFNFPKINTNTISQDKDKNFICSMFKKRVKKFQLLYRASHNGFKIHKFHQKCDGQTNTLVLVRTQADKVIGGFTVLAWDKLKIPKQDKSRQSFLFSVTQQEIYELSLQKACITGVPRIGPIFGQSQIQIRDQSHINQSSFFLGTVYKGNGIEKNNSFSNEHFSGTQTGKIKVKQWEVFKVHFA